MSFCVCDGYIFDLGGFPGNKVNAVNSVFNRLTPEARDLPFKRLMNS
jgi:hypothetical protein